jgi:hypothetical protein
MTLYEAMQVLVRFHSWDFGDRGHGLCDQTLRAELAQLIDAADLADVRVTLGRFVREEFLSEDALDAGYGPEDALDFLNWFCAGDFRP